MFSVVNRGQLNGTTEHEFENLNSRLKGLWLTEHNEDGTHNIAAMDFSELRLQAGNISSGVFDTSLIPDLDASKIVSGTFAAARIPSLDASKITSGTFSSARLPATVAYTDVANTFSQNQLVTKSLPELQVKRTSSTGIGRLFQYNDNITDISNNLAASGGGAWNLDNTSTGGSLLELPTSGIAVYTASAGTNPRTLSQILAVSSSGIFERGRGTAMGTWISFTPTLSVVTGAGTWTPDGSSQLACSYALIGNVAVVAININSVPVTGSPTVLGMSLPFTAAQSTRISAPFFSNGSGWLNGQVQAVGGAAQIQFTRDGGAAFVASSGVYWWPHLTIIPTGV